MLTLLSLLAIAIFSYYLIWILFYLGICLMRVCIYFLAGSLIAAFLITVYGIIMIPLIAVVMGIIMLSFVCRRLLHQLQINIRM